MSKWCFCLIFNFCCGVDDNVACMADIECQFINCGEGVCKASNETLLGFDCECNPGWKKIHVGVGLLTIPTCVPNCESLSLSLSQM